MSSSDSARVGGAALPPWLLLSAVRWHFVSAFYFLGVGSELLFFLVRRYFCGSFFGYSCYSSMWDLGFGERGEFDAVLRIIDLY